MKQFASILALVVLALAPLAAPAQTAVTGFRADFFFQQAGVEKEILALAEAVPAEKYSWRPAEGVRSIGEVYMHLVIANFWLLSVTGPKMPADLKQDAEKTVTSKPEVIEWLKRSLEAVK